MLRSNVAEDKYPEDRAWPMFKTLQFVLEKRLASSVTKQTRRMATPKLAPEWEEVWPTTVLFRCKTKLTYLATVCEIIQCPSSLFDCGVPGSETGAHAKDSDFAKAFQLRNLGKWSFCGEYAHHTA